MDAAADGVDGLGWGGVRGAISRKWLGKPKYQPGGGRGPPRRVYDDAGGLGEMMGKGARGKRPGRTDAGRGGFWGVRRDGGSTSEMKGGGRRKGCGRAEDGVGGV